MLATTSNAIKLEPKRKISSKTKKTYSINQSIVVVVIVSIIVFAFVSLSQSNAMSDNRKVVTALKSEVGALKEQNDLKEMALKSDIDMKEVEAVAKGRLGMQKINHSQIRNFSSKQEEYFKVFIKK